MVPSIGGGTKLIRTLLAGDDESVCSGVGGVGEGIVDCSGEIEEDSSAVAEGFGVGDSCAVAIATKQTQPIHVTIRKKGVAIRDLSIVTPVHIWKNIVPPFAVPEKFFIDGICDKLIVQTIETSKVINSALSCVFARSPGFYQECPIT